ncbi:MAG: hypothetical protein KBT46_04585, partial [Ruminococcus sp.]|nr:hypothetical protein [Candidatus Copronaster equi]
YDYESNRIKIAFMLTYDNGEFADEYKTGACFNINSLGQATIKADATTEYNETVYYVQLIEEKCDPVTHSILIETVIGLKNGLTPHNIMSVYFFDTHGVRSNTFTVDISDINQTASVTVSSSEKPSKTTKLKTTKSKTTKIKTTKSKTAKLKTTKTKSFKNQTKENKITETLSSIAEQNSVSATQNKNIIKNDEKITFNEEKESRKNILIAGIALSVIAVAAGCAVSIINKKKN